MELHLFSIVEDIGCLEEDNDEYLQDTQRESSGEQL